ncbi:uncharacterized protein BROUX77_006408 [Berkeleyomyces rouxiae]|uniref:uncharacterized protein n=1 Tax=Berkeleyomyces rouxiae TaxID=2035830 RepID=UPI003B7771F3
MELIGAAANVVSVVELSAQVGVLCFQYGKDVKNAPFKIRQLRQEVANLQGVTEKVLEFLEKPNGENLKKSKSLDDVLEGSRSLLLELSEKLEPNITRKTMKRLGLRALKWPFQRGEVEALIDQLQRHNESISHILQVHQTEILHEVHQDVKGVQRTTEHTNQAIDQLDQTIQQAGKEVERIDRTTAQTKLDVAQVDQSVTHLGEEVGQAKKNLIVLDHKNVLSTLPMATGASFNSYEEQHNPTCLPDTRVELLQEIQNWASDSSTKSLFWLNGMAGTGKSTISRTICQRLLKSDQLGASFFFKRGEADRGGLSRFVTTLAAQLVHMHPSVSEHIKTAIDDDPGIHGKSTIEQFDKLIKQPLSKIPFDSQKVFSLVFVIDALDECDKDNDVRAIINLFSSCAKDPNFKLRLKCLITSRPELPIRLGFSTVKGTFQDLILQDIAPHVIEHDIAAFLDHEISKIRMDYNETVATSRQLPPSWPGTENLQTLVKMAVPLFIFAATTCRFIGDRNCGNPNTLLKEILKFQTGAETSQLDATYLPVLNRLINGLSTQRRNKMIKRFQNIAGPIVILATPLSKLALGELIDVPTETIEEQLDLLHSVLSVPQSIHSPVRLLHLSFRDFLLDPQKQDKSPFWIDEKETHKKMTSNCLRIMNNHLRTDICQLVHPVYDRAKVEAQVIQDNIPAELQYSCLYWVNHVQQGEVVVDDSSKIFGFLKAHFLHWLEVLSLLGRSSESVKIIRGLLLMLTPEGSRDLRDFLRDALRLTLSNLQMIDIAPLQIYSSILALTPKNSPVRRAFQGHIPKWITLPPELEDEWDQCQQILEGPGGPLTFVVFSPNGELIASLSDDNSIQLWRSDDGTYVSEVMCHQDRVQSIVFSPDSTLLASASDDQTIILWGTDDGSCLNELKGHEGGVNSVDFSPDGMLIVSGSGDHTVRLWKSHDGSFLRQLSGHDSVVYSVVFSPDGTLVASCSMDHVIRLWKTETGTCLRQLVDHELLLTSAVFSPDGLHIASTSLDHTVYVWSVEDATCVYHLKGHQDKVSSAVFSPDGSLVASVSQDRTIRLWRMEDGICAHELRGHKKRVNSVAFSPDGTLVASASLDRTVCLWNSGNGACVQELKGHEFPAVSVAFSPDGTCVASASIDSTVRVWSSDVSAFVQGLKGHQDQVSSVVLSPNGTLIASASYDGTARLWKSDDGTCLHELRGHENRINCVTFSPDSTLIASGSNDGTARLWKTEDGTCVVKVKGHNGGVKSVTFSSDGTLIASISTEPTVRLWKTDNGMCVQELKGHAKTANAAAFSPDGNLVASASYDNTVRLWRSKDGFCISELKGHEGSVNSVAFSPDGTLVASVSDDHTVRLWRVSDGVCMHELKGHNSAVSAVAFSPDGSLLASGSSDRSVRLWRTYDGSSLRELYYTWMSRLEFDTSEPYLRTDYASIAIHDLIPYNGKAASDSSKRSTQDSSSTSNQTSKEKSQAGFKMANYNPGNYHYVFSNVTKEWVTGWLKENIETVKATEGELSARVTHLVDATGDFSVYNRKGQVYATVELDLTVEYSGSTPDDEEVTGTLTISQFDNANDDSHVYEIKVELQNEDKAKLPVKNFVRSKLAPQLIQLCKNMSTPMIERHRGVVQHAAGADPSKGFTPAKVYVNPSATKPSTSSAAANSEPTKKNAPVNTTTVTDTEEFRTTAEELYKTFTDVARISAFTRGHPKVFEGAKQGGKFEIFDGNVSGQYLELEEPKRIVQTWRLKQWPADHFSRLEISFDQNNVDHVTVMNVKWTGVPTGEEDVTKRNWRDYYVRSIKQTFGFGTIL